MKNINITIVGLTIITLCELFYAGEINNSVTLWFGYGIYRGIRYVIKNGILD